MISTKKKYGDMNPGFCKGSPIFVITGGWMEKWWKKWELFYEISWLVISTPLKNMNSSVGMIIPNIWKNKIHVSNHQPVMEKWKAFMKIQYHLAI